MDGDRVDTFGYRYLLPVRFTYDAHAGHGTDRLRYSFASLDRSTTPHRLVAGEYGRADMTTRLVRYEIDPVSSLLRAEPDGRSLPLRSTTVACPACRARPSWTTRGSSPPAAGATGWAACGSAARARCSSTGGSCRSPEDITYWPRATSSGR